jgi:hypothetical protein
MGNFRDGLRGRSGFEVFVGTSSKIGSQASYSVRFSDEGHIIPANKAGGIVALRPHFQPIAKGSDYIDPGSFGYLRQNP